jgi:hypothetical protein
LIGKEIGMTFEERYLSKSAFSDTSKEHEMEEVDIGIKIDDLWKEDYDEIGEEMRESEPEDDSKGRPCGRIEWATDWLCTREGDTM